MRKRERTTHNENNKCSCPSIILTHFPSAYHEIVVCTKSLLKRDEMNVPSASLLMTPNWEVW